MSATTRIGEPAPGFSLMCIRAEDECAHPVALSDYRGRWLMLFFYPRDFSFVCPTELTTFSARVEEFAERQCAILAVSVDSIALHQEWLSTAPSAGGVGALQFPLGSDPDGVVAEKYGVWVPDKEVSARGMFLIDPEGILQYVVLHNLNVGRTPDEVLRVLDALRTGGLCPASWTSADGTIDLETALEAGRILGHYRIRKRLGGGGFGTVFAAWDMRLERTVALKILHRALRESRAAALVEARAAARLNHPHVCSVYAVEEEDGLPVIVMEYLDGQLLSEAIAEPLPARQIERLARQIAAGLAAAHRQEVIHGDLKPANIIVTRDGMAKILDFGLARSERREQFPRDSAVRHTPATPELTADLEHARLCETVVYQGRASLSETAIRGTLAYLSPEQAAGQPSTSASDIFSLGIVLFEMFTGKPALGERKPLEVLSYLQSPDLTQGLVSRADGRYQTLLSGMLQRDPASRPSAGEVVLALSSLAAV
jgi:eukaryotic-like serine/threonine-protein kinase